MVCPDFFSTHDLAQACAQQASRPRASAHEPDACFELFCRAFGTPVDDAAWQAILSQYFRLVSFWLGQYANEDAVQEVFTRFWKAQQRTNLPFTARFANIKAIIAYLKLCAITVRIEVHRWEERQQVLMNRLREAAVTRAIIAGSPALVEQIEPDLKELVLSKLKDERERVIFELTYRQGMLPAEIQARRPDLFPNTTAVSRAKENLLKRLGRDADLDRLWKGS